MKKTDWLKLFGMVWVTIFIGSLLNCVIWNLVGCEPLPQPEAQQAALPTEATQIVGPPIPPPEPEDVTIIGKPRHIKDDDWEVLIPETTITVRDHTGMMKTDCQIWIKIYPVAIVNPTETPKKGRK